MEIDAKRKSKLKVIFIDTCLPPGRLDTNGYCLIYGRNLPSGQEGIAFGAEWKPLKYGFNALCTDFLVMAN